MPPFGSERRYVEPRRLNRCLLAVCGWRQIGPWIRYWHVARAIRELQPARILEAGCGWGQNLFALQRQFPDAVLIGVDRDAAMVEVGRRIAARLPGRQPQFVLGDLHAVSLEGVFELIVMVDVLEYVADDALVLRRCRELLADNGRFILHVPRRITEQRRVLPVSHDIPGHARPEYTRQEIVDKVQEAGCELEEVRATFGLWGTLAWECGRVCERFKPFGALCFPFLLLLARLDYWGKPHDGNGYLLVARRRITHA